MWFPVVTGVLTLDFVKGLCAREASLNRSCNGRRRRPIARLAVRVRRVALRYVD